MCNHPFREETPPNVQPKLLLAQPKAFPVCCPRFPAGRAVCCAAGLSPPGPQGERGTRERVIPPAVPQPGESRGRHRHPARLCPALCPALAALTALPCSALLPGCRSVCRGGAAWGWREHAAVVSPDPTLSVQTQQNLVFSEVNTTFNETAGCAQCQGLY